jgi:hypothetical protein
MISIVEYVSSLLMGLFSMYVPYIHYIQCYMSLLANVMGDPFKYNTVKNNLYQGLTVVHVLQYIGRKHFQANYFKCVLF